MTRPVPGTTGSCQLSKNVHQLEEPSWDLIRDLPSQNHHDSTFFLLLPVVIVNVVNLDGTFHSQTKSSEKNTLTGKVDFLKIPSRPVTGRHMRCAKRSLSI
jgi:hypothetical protein